MDCSTQHMESVMTDPSLARIESALRVQHAALAELIAIALAAVRESGESSVSAIHLTTRLGALASSLEAATPAMAKPVRPGMPTRK
jgi:hypothetical protein